MNQEPLFDFSLFVYEVRTKSDCRRGFWRVLVVMGGSRGFWWFWRVLVVLEGSRGFWWFWRILVVIVCSGRL